MKKNSPKAAHGSRRKPRRGRRRTAVVYGDFLRTRPLPKNARLVYDMLHRFNALNVASGLIRLKLINRYPLLPEERRFHLERDYRRRPGRPRKWDDMPAWYRNKLESQRAKYRNRKKT